jgi:23S rRNA pseudouridine2604 synthase
MREPIRLDKRCVELFGCSRGEAVKYIQGGWVRVDDEVEERPQFKVQDQKIELIEGATLDPIKAVTLIFNVPEGFSADDSTAIQKLITPESHCEEDYSGIKILNKHFHDLKPTTPLQNGASGLMVFSKDYNVLRVLLDNNIKKEEEYIIEFSDEYTPEALEQLNKLAYGSDKSHPQYKVSMQNEKRMRFVTKYAQPDQIETLCERVGLKTVAIKRIRIGKVSMKDLPPGEWRYLADNTMF